MGKSVTLILPVEVVDIRPRADGSWKVSFETRELAGEEVATLADSLHGAGWMAFSRTEEALPVLPDEPAETGVKSRSERLRNTMYAAWKSHGGHGSFDAYRDTQMERLIELYKSKIVQE